MNDPTKPYLRAGRARRFLSQQELADRAGVSKRTIIHLETADAPRPRGSTVRKLAASLGIEPADLFRAPAEGE